MLSTSHAGNMASIPSGCWSLEQGMKRSLLIGLAAGIGLCVAPASAHAHHSYPTFFDLCQSVTITGQVATVQWKNPHVLIELKADDGTRYLAEWTSVEGVTRVSNVDALTLKAGDRLVVTGSPARSAAQIRVSYPALDPALTIVSALVQVRRPSDGWNWARAYALPPECASK